MNEFRVELFIDNEDGENIEVSNLSEKDMKQWKKGLEERTLSEYYDQKVNIKVKI